MTIIFFTRCYFDLNEWINCKIKIPATSATADALASENGPGVYAIQLYLPESSLMTLRICIRFSFSFQKIRLAGLSMARSSAPSFIHLYLISRRLSHLAAHLRFMLVPSSTIVSWGFVEITVSSVDNEINNSENEMRMELGYNPGGKLSPYMGYIGVCRCEG